MKCKCQATVGYALVDTQTKKAHRFSFSVSLLEHIQKEFTNLTLAKVWYELTDKPTGLYALVKKSGWILRVTPHESLINKWIHSRVLKANVKIVKIQTLERQCLRINQYCKWRNRQTLTEVQKMCSCKLPSIITINYFSCKVSTQVSMVITGRILAQRLRPRVETRQT